MKRWSLILLVVPVALAGLVFAVSNAGAVSLDLFGLVLELPLGVVVLGALFAGCIAGGAVLWAGVILPLRVRLRQAQRREAAGRPGPAA
jgi:uncharacterized integral membrane protein